MADENANPKVKKTTGADVAKTPEEAAVELAARDKQLKRSVTVAEVLDRRLAVSKPDHPGAGGIDLVSHKKVKLKNGLVITNN